MTMTETTPPTPRPAGPRAGRPIDDCTLYAEILRLRQVGVASLLATVVDSQGSSPRKAGAKMLVRGDGSTLGTIGGGGVEHAVIAAAPDVLREGQARLSTFALSAANGHACGGTMRIYLEPSVPAPRLIIVGAGHIGSALTTIAGFCGFHVTVVDERADYANSVRLPDADAIFAAPADSVLPTLAADARTAIVIATTDYPQDFAAVRCALATAAGFIGLVGSRRKQALLSSTLADAGYTPADIARVHSPVGLAIGAQTPQEIALSIGAQLVAHLRQAH